MFMAFLSKPSHRPWLAATFALLLALGTGFLLLR